MDGEIEKKLTYLEARMNVISDNLKECCDAVNKNAICIGELQERETKMNELHLRRFDINERSLNSLAKDHAEIINGLQRGMQQMQEAYYHVFPERLAQDVRVAEQLNGITARPAPGADPKKT